MSLSHRLSVVFLNEKVVAWCGVSVITEPDLLSYFTVSWDHQLTTGQDNSWFKLLLVLYRYLPEEKQEVVLLSYASKHTK